MANDTKERGLSINHNVKTKNFPSGTTETGQYEVDSRIYNNPDYILIHAVTNNLTKIANSLNHIKKIVKKLKTRSPKTRIAFSGIITRKYKKDTHTRLNDTNSRLKNY